MFEEGENCSRLLRSFRRVGKRGRELKKGAFDEGTILWILRKANKESGHYSSTGKGGQGCRRQGKHAPWW